MPGLKLNRNCTRVHSTAKPLSKSLSLGPFYAVSNSFFKNFYTEVYFNIHYERINAIRASFFYLHWFETAIFLLATFSNCKL